MNPCEICKDANCDSCCISCEYYDADNDRCNADGCRMNAEGSVREAIGIPAAHEGLAEEAVELAHAALKVARILRGENPTPEDLKKAQKALIVEFTDLMIYADILDLADDPDIYLVKFKRMEARIREARA